MLHDDQPSLLRVLGPAVFFTIYSRIKHMTVEELVESAMPAMEEFIAGYQLGRETADDEDEDDVSFDPPGGFPPPNGRDPNPPQPAPRKRRKKPAKAAKAAAPKEPKTPKKKPKKKSPPKAQAEGAPKGTAALDEHVLSLLKAKADWTPSRDLAPLVRGVNDNQLRKSLARLVETGLVVTTGATKSKRYKAS